MNEFIKQIKSKVEEIETEIKQRKEELKNYSKKVFGAAAKSIFDTFPRVESIEIKGFTPYFNDGSECVFSVNRDNIKINGFGEYDDHSAENLFYIGKKYVLKRLESPDDFSQYEQYLIETVEKRCHNPIYGYVLNPEGYEEEAYNIVKDVEDFFSCFSDEILREMFDDHWQLIITRDGVKVEEYSSHD